MKVTRTSKFTGETHVRDINITPEQLAEINEPLQSGRRFVQDIVPNLSADDREFLISGVTPEEWAEYCRAFGDDDEG